MYHCIYHGRNTNKEKYGIPFCKECGWDEKRTERYNRKWEREQAGKWSPFQYFVLVWFILHTLWVIVYVL